MLSVRKLVFAGALLAVVPFAAVAEEPKAAPKAMPPGATLAPATPVAPAAPGQPCTTTVRVCKLVPTTCEETRTVMKPVQKTETYTAYRTETVTEKKIVPVTTHKTETYTEMVTKTCCVKVPVYEEKVVMEKRKKIEWVTEYKQKCHVSFTKDYKTIGCGDKCGGGLGDKCGLGNKCGLGDKCGGGDKCNKGFNFSIPVYKPHFETKTVACTVPKCTWECVPVTKKCCTWKTEMKTTTVPVCKTRCVPCTENKEVCCTKKVCVPYQATRCVTVCEAVTEKVQVTKMVPTWVEEQVAVAPAPAADACDNVADKGCDDAGKGGCFNFCGKFKDCCSGFGDKFKGGCGKLKGCFSCK